MSKLEGTNFMIDYISNLKESGLNVDNTIMLADIAESLAMIADKLCGEENEGEMTNQEKFIKVFGIDAWREMINPTADQFKEFWTSPYKEQEE